VTIIGIRVVLTAAKKMSCCAACGRSRALMTGGSVSRGSSGPRNSAGGVDRCPSVMVSPSAR